ncbi:MAG: hypothetical protein EOP48_30660 [Sphingobacteriales bacterium]|nr:MAG: hypothetical protein EOP48_30660 [Sphingobacteriales bacterium]
MVYPDPNRVRANRHNVRFDQYEEDLIKALSNYLGIEPAALIRELALKQALQELTLAADPIQNENFNTDAAEHL